MSDIDELMKSLGCVWSEDLGAWLHSGNGHGHTTWIDPEFLQGIVKYGDKRELDLKTKLRGAERLMIHSEPADNGCINWTASKSPSGYGNMEYRDSVFSSKKAHRVAYYIFKGIDPLELTIDHTCNNTSCINTNHMVLVTRSYNSTRKTKAPEAIDICPSGHKYEGDNLISREYISKGKRKFSRSCRQCKRAKDANYRATKRLAELKKQRGES